MRNSSTKLFLVFLAASMIISSSYFYMMTARGQFVIPQSPPLEVWMDVSPNPAYLGEDIQISIFIKVDSTELFGKQVELTAIMVPTSSVPELKSISTSTCKTKIPQGCTVYPSTDELLKNLTGDYSAEIMIQVQTVVEGYNVNMVSQGTFHIYNYSRPPDKPNLLLRSSLEYGEELREGVVTVEVKNIGSGNAKNIEIKNSLPLSSALVSGALNQKYDSIGSGETKTFKYIFKLLKKEDLFVFDSATATYEDGKGISYSSKSNPFYIAINQQPTFKIRYPGEKGWEEREIPLEELTPTPSPTLILSPTPMLPGKGDYGWWIFIISAITLVFSAAILYKPMMLRYYRWKMRKWEEKYDGTPLKKLKEVLGDER